MHESYFEKNVKLQHYQQRIIIF